MFFAGRNGPRSRQPRKPPLHGGVAEAFREYTLTLVRTRHPARKTATPQSQSRCSAQLASDHSPTDPVLRANPCPEVTDQFCRLPLPTLFYRPEAVHLGDLLRIWVRSQHENHTISLGFSRADKAHWTPQEPRCFTVTTSLSPAKPIPGSPTPYKEKTTLPRAFADVSEFVCVTALDLRRGLSPCLGLGILTQFPFGLYSQSH